MVRVLIVAVTAACLLAAAARAAGDDPPGYRLTVGLDVSWVDASGFPSWTGGGAGKLRYDGRTDGFVASRAFADYELRLADTVDGHLVAELYDDGFGSTADLSEAYLAWRPLTVSANRYRVRVGAFYPHLSLENVGPAWSSPYSISSSAINTWIAEELRVVGAELSVSRRPEVLGGAHTFSVHGAVFGGNDPTGALLAWKGWSVHDRQSRLGDELPLPSLPQLQPDGHFWRQAEHHAPFTEVDDRPGWYAGGEWRYGSRLMARALCYDNRGVPTALRDGQYAWGTDFVHLGAQAVLPGDVGLIAQWMRGTTVMGPVIDGAHVVDNDFESRFVLLTRQFKRHRVTARYDDFGVSETDRVPLDENSESGHAWTLAWAYRAADSFTLAVEWLRIRSNRPAWAYADHDVARTERQLQVSARLEFDTR